MLNDHFCQSQGHCTESQSLESIKFLMDSVLTSLRDIGTCAQRIEQPSLVRRHL
jgi:hypothetical protein